MSFVRSNCSLIVLYFENCTVQTTNYKVYLFIHSERVKICGMLQNYCSILKSKNAYFQCSEFYNSNCTRDNNPFCHNTQDKRNN